MYLMKDIIREGDQILNSIAKEVSLPLSIEDYNTLKQLQEYVVISEDEKLVNELKIRPGVGLAAPQVGVSKRMFAINCIDFLDEKETRYNWAVINPIILRKSQEMTYLPNGEGCLSVDRVVSGVTPRYYQIEIKATLFDFKLNKMKTIKATLEGFPAIVFQHEYDHLDGILFTEKLIKDTPDNDKIFPLYTLKNNEDEENNQVIQTDIVNEK